MTPETNHWYSVRLGQWIESARVDGYDECRRKWLVYVPSLAAWRQLPRSAFIRETEDPEQLAAMERQRRMESRLQTQEAIWSQESTAPAPVDRASGCGGEGESRFYAIVCRQGSRFLSGDYGISRE